MNRYKRLPKRGVVYRGDFDEVVRDIKDRVSIVDLASQTTELEKSGSRYQCRCPFHEESSPSCVIYPGNNSWYCYGCRQGGDVIQWVMLAKNLDFLSAVESLKQSSFTLPKIVRVERKEVEKKIEPVPWSKVMSFADNMTYEDVSYLKDERRWSVEVQRAYFIGKSSSGRFSIPIKSYHDSTVLDVRLYKPDRKGTEPKMLPMTPIGALPFFLGRRNQKVLVCEGEPDALCARSILPDDWDVVTNTCGVVSATKVWRDYLFFFDNKGVVICFDGDMPGHKAAADLADIVPRAKIVSPSLRKDITEMVKWLGPEWLTDAVGEAIGTTVSVAKTFQ